MAKASGLGNAYSEGVPPHNEASGDLEHIDEYAAEQQKYSQRTGGGAANRKILCDIARCAFEVVNRILERDRVLARDLRTSTTRSRQIFREESITVEIAATLQEQFSKHVKIHLFTPNEENKNGADWYWRFERDNRAIHAYVQAKRVQRTSFGQDDDQGHIDIDRPQLARLLRTKASSRLPELDAWIATYARFDATPPCGQAGLQHCYRHRHAEECMHHEHRPSVWIADAGEIEGLGISRAQVSRIVEKSLRLDCLLPCIDGTLGSGPAIKGFTLKEGLPTYQDSIEIIESDVQLRMEFAGALRITV